MLRARIKVRSLSSTVKVRVNGSHENQGPSTVPPAHPQNELPYPVFQVKNPVSGLFWKSGKKRGLF
jgi:hypothetical protein